MNIEQIAKWVIEHFEGFSFTDDPVDLGGATKFGITQRTLAYYRKKYSKNYNTTKADVMALTLPEAIFIGATVFGRESRIDELTDWRLKLIVYDYYFHSGPRAIKALQSAVGTTVDGQLGPQTLHAANAACSTELGALRLALNVLTLRELFMQDLMVHQPPQRKWLLGWWARTTKVQQMLLGGAA